MVEPTSAQGSAHERGLLIEYAATARPLVLPFLFNPSTITRTRSVSVNTSGAPGARGGHSFFSPAETQRASQGVQVAAETFSFAVLLDATDRMAAGDPLATAVGVQPEIDVIRTMLEPKVRATQGARDLAAAAGVTTSVASSHASASVLLFKWGVRVLPVFMTQAQVETIAHLPNLFPYRARATLSLQVIETDNPFYSLELTRQEQSARSLGLLSAVSGAPFKI